MRPSSVPRSVELRIRAYPALVIDGVVAPLKLKRALALLAYLAELGRKCSRAKIAALLWPDANESVGRTRLRRMTHHVNGVASFELLKGDGDALWISTGSVRFFTDVESTRRCAREVLASLPASATKPNIAALLDPTSHQLLDGFTLDCDIFDEWLALRRVEHERLIARTLQRLAEHLTTSGQVAVAVEAAERLIRIDPFAEAGYASLVVARGREGDSAAVECAYFRCAEMLRKEFGARPSPLFEAAYASAREAASNAIRVASPLPLPRIRFAQSCDGSVAYIAQGSGPRP